MAAPEQPLIASLTDGQKSQLSQSMTRQLQSMGQNDVDASLLEYICLLVTTHSAQHLAADLDAFFGADAPGFVTWIEHEIVRVFACLPHSHVFESVLSYLWGLFGATLGRRHCPRVPHRRPAAAHPRNARPPRYHRPWKPTRHNPKRLLLPLGHPPLLL